MNKLALFVAVPFIALSSQAQAEGALFGDSIKHLGELRVELVKDLDSAKGEKDVLETAKHIIDIDTALEILKATEILHENLKKSAH